MAMTYLKHQQRNPSEILLLLQLLVFLCILLTTTVLGSDNVVQNGECESNNDPGQCLATTLNANRGEEAMEDVKADANNGDMSWYRRLSECEDFDRDFGFWAEENECSINPGGMLHLCSKSCNVCDNISGDYVANCYSEDQLVSGSIAERAQTAKRVREMEDYMLQEVLVEEKYSTIRAGCKNRDKECSFWAVEGECEANPKFMTMQCSPACFSREQLDISIRCPFDRDAPTIWGPGDLNAMFERIVMRPANEQYNMRIHSSPRSNQAQHEEGGNDGPWVVTLDDFLSPAECERLIQLGHDIGYERSEDVGAQKFDGTHEPLINPDRTSTTAWCLDDCFDDPVTLAVRERIEELTGIPDANSEYLQLLRYEEGQRYMVHHDYIDFLKDRAQGVRILTVFLYLSNVEKGGGTHFPKLDLTVMPKQGRVLIWPSVLNTAPDDIDERTDHEALPIEAGIKYSANGWIHSRDFKSFFVSRCNV